MSIQHKRATFGAGCFWGVEHYFRQIAGVQDVAVGYGGGQLINPTYEDICYKDTGHAELVDITFNATIISYNDLVQHFWGCHNPTQLNRQGVDIGRQYRSVIFNHDDEQYQTALASKEQAQQQFAQPIVTIITPFVNFYRAEEYHQRYIEKKSS